MFCDITHSIQKMAQIFSKLSCIHTYTQTKLFRDLQQDSVGGGFSRPLKEHNSLCNHALNPYASWDNEFSISSSSTVLAEYFIKRYGAVKQIEFAIKKTSAYQKLSPKSDTGDLICTSLAWSFPVTIDSTSLQGRLHTYDDKLQGNRFLDCLRPAYCSE